MAIKAVTAIASAKDWKVGPAQIMHTGARISPHSGEGGR